jgi:FMN phosphatase YigB (HAD superfamily)
VVTCLIFDLDDTLCDYRQAIAEQKLTVEEYRFRRYADVLREWDESKLKWVDHLNTVYMDEANHRVLSCLKM